MFIDKLERRFGHLGVPNLTVILIAGQVMAYIARELNPEVVARIILIPQRVLDGQVYRLLTFVFLPPSMNLLFAFFFWLLFYIMGTSLENYWGTFRYNVFLLIGYLATVTTSFLTPESPVTNLFVQGTVFFAFAFLNPTFELRIMFILPVQIRWLALLQWILYGTLFFNGNWAVKIQVAASVINFFIFFRSDIYYRIVDSRRMMARRAQHLAAARNQPDYFHICASCGITDKTDPQMDFRYCSQCSGNVAYCSEHLRDHEHVQE